MILSRYLRPNLTWPFVFLNESLLPKMTKMGRKGQNKKDYCLDYFKFLAFKTSFNLEWNKDKINQNYKRTVSFEIFTTSVWLVLSSFKVKIFFWLISVFEKSSLPLIIRESRKSFSSGVPKGKILHAISLRFPDTFPCRYRNYIVKILL